MFKFKDNIPTPLMSSLVYQYNCNRCNSIYVGKTTRHLATRISEHRGISPRTGAQLGKPIFSSIRNHVYNIHNSNLISPDQFKIVCTSNYDYELLIKESILIKKLQPDLNNNDSLSLKVF